MTKIYLEMQDTDLGVSAAIEQNAFLNKED